MLLLLLLLIVISLIISIIIIIIIITTTSTIIIIIIIIEPTFYINKFYTTPALGPVGQRECLRLLTMNSCYYSYSTFFFTDLI